MATMTIPAVWNQALDEVAAALLDRAEMTGPPVDTLELAERLSIIVAFDSTQRARGRHKTLTGRASIFLKPDERPERLQWAAAHELGEVVAWRVFDRVPLPDGEVPSRLREQVANLLASRLLLPSRWFGDDARRLRGDLLELKRVYRTASHELIAYRMLDLPEQTIVSVFDHGRLTRRRSNGYGKPPRLQPVERDCWAEVHRSNRPVEMQERGLTVQGWPIHEPGWQREILRTTAACDADDAERSQEWEPGSPW